MILKTRNNFADLLNRMALTGNAVEVGVAEGYFGFHLLDHWKGTLFMVDPWEILTTRGYSGHGESTRAGMDARFERIKAMAKKYGDRCYPLRQVSSVAVQQFADKTLDFVYLDACHDLESIKEDISLWYPKMKPGSIFAGHDYLDGEFHGQQYGVKQAVTEFAAERGLKVNVIPEEWPSWWLQL